MHNEQKKQQKNILSLPQHTYQQPSPTKLTSPQEIKYKIGQLENKSKFFEGQLDPLKHENMVLKQQVIQAKRMLQNATQQLRNLLPLPSSPQKRLQLQLANIEGISKFIKLDWLHMKQQIAQYCKQLQQKQKQIHNLQLTIIQNSQSHQKHIQQLTQQHQQQIDNILTKHEQQINQKQLQIIFLTTNNTTLKQQKQKSIKQLTQFKTKYNKQVNQYKHKIAKIQQQVQKKNQQIRIINQQHQMNRKLLIQHYQALAVQKQQQLKQSFQYLIAAKQQQYMRNIKQVNQYTNTINMKLMSKQQQILQLYQLNNKYITQKQQLSTLCKLNQQKLAVQKQNVSKLKLVIQQNRLKQQQMKKQYEHNYNAKCKQITTLNQNIAGLNSNVQKLKTKQAGLIKQHKQQLAIKDKQISRIYNQVQRYTTQNTYKQSQILQLTQQIQHNQQQLRIYSKYKQQNEQLLTQIQQYKQTQQQANNKILQYSQQIQIKQSQIKQLNQLHTKQKLLKQEQIKAQVQLIRKQFVKKQNQIEQNHREYNAMIAKQQADKVYQMQLHYNRMEDQYKHEAGNLKQTITKLTNSKEGLEKQLVALQQQTQSKIKNILEQHKQQLKTAQNQYFRMLQERHNIYNKQVENVKRQLKQRQAQYEQNLNEQEKKYKEIIGAKDSQYNSQLQVLRKNIQNLKAANGVAEVQNRYIKMINKVKQQAANDKQNMIQQKKKQIEQINKNHTEKLESLKYQHENKLQQLKTSHINQINELKTTHENKQQKLKNTHITKTQQLQQKFDEQLQTVSQKLLTNITILSHQLKQQKQAHQYSKLTRQQKVAYLSNKILQINKNNNQKEIKIAQLQNTLDQKIKQLSDIDKLVDEMLVRKKQQYQAKIKSTTQQCNRLVTKSVNQCNQKVEYMEKQRVKFTQNMYKDFKQIKNKYQIKLKSIQRKYEELQKLFQERPSRQQDLKRINQLILSRQKMDLQVKQFKKKIVSANQIVKYLSLQLQNYKDVYDIFGPQLATDAQEINKKQQQFTGYVRDNIDSLVNQPTNRITKKQQVQKNKYMNIRKMLRDRNRRSNTQMSHSNLTQSKGNLHQDRNATLIQKVAQQSQQQKIQIKDKKISQSIAKITPVEKIKQNKIDKTNIYSNQKLKKTMQRQQKLDTTTDLRNNAQIFLSLIQRGRKPVTQGRTSSQSYMKMSSRKKNSSIVERKTHKEKQHKYNIKDKIVSLD